MSTPCCILLNMSESKFFKELMLAFYDITTKDSRLFRNNVGEGWVGKHFIDGARVILKPFRRIKFGLAVGSSDAIGWTQVTITPDMIGKQLAVFTAVETKSLKGSASQQQKDFLATVKRCGGIAVKAKSLDDLKHAVDSYKSSFK